MPACGKCIQSPRFLFHSGGSGSLVGLLDEKLFDGVTVVHDFGWEEKVDEKEKRGISVENWESEAGLYIPLCDFMLFGMGSDDLTLSYSVYGTLEPVPGKRGQSTY